jgi:hypothetical protein
VSAAVGGVTALQRRESALPRPLRTPGRVPWFVRQVALFGAAMVMLPLISQLALVFPVVSAIVWMLVWVAIVAWWFGRRILQSSKDLQEVAPLVRGGEMETAQPKLVRALGRASGPMAPQFAAMLGAVEIELGRVEHGLAILESARRSGWFDTGPHGAMRAALLGSIATGHAYLGENDVALAELDAARGALPAGQRGLLLADEALVLARAGRYAELDARIAADLDAAEQALPAWGIKWIGVLHSFARASAGGTYRAEADDELPKRLADPRVRRSLLRLGAGWPELAAFLAAHGVHPAA